LVDKTDAEHQHLRVGIATRFDSGPVSFTQLSLPDRLQRERRPVDIFLDREPFPFSRDSAGYFGTIREWNQLEEPTVSQ
jgi:hypothetical protein